MKVFLIASALMALASADPYYGGYYGYHQQHWPSAYGPGFQATCYGCRGKRSAEPEPGYYGYGGGIAHHPYGGSSYVGRTIWGFPGHYRGKRSADADAEPGYYGGGYAYHPYGATSYVGRTIWGFPGYHRGKRSAEPEPFWRYGLGNIPTVAGPTGIARHPTGTSYVANSPWGLH